jgi:hypothetical protein
MASPMMPANEGVFLGSSLRILGNDSNDTAASSRVTSTTVSSGCALRLGGTRACFVIFCENGDEFRIRVEGYAIHTACACIFFMLFVGMNVEKGTTVSLIVPSHRIGWYFSAIKLKTECFSPSCFFEAESVVCYLPEVGGGGVGGGVSPPPWLLQLEPAPGRTEPSQRLVVLWDQGLLQPTGP